jgi:hypothetical protein
MALILEIQKGEKVPLPEDFHKINNLCANIYDQISDIFRDENYSFLRETNFDIDKSQKKVKEFQNKEIHPLDWLKENDLTDEIEIVVTKTILNAVTADFLNFVFESIHCAKRGKMTVAYSLIRKPITDSLLILEELLIDRKNFIEKFYFNSDITKYDPSRRNLDKLKIIETAISKLGFKNIFNAEYIHELRYDKKSDIGFNSISNKSIHIVTNDKNYKTENGEFNFIFSNNEDQEYYYKHYYNLVAYLLIYSASIINELISSLSLEPKQKEINTIKEFKRLIGLLLYSEYCSSSETPEKTSDIIYEKISENIIIKCENCNSKNTITKPDCILLFEANILLCTNCFNDLLATSSKTVVEQIKLFRDIK